jgi:hypothetical protein
VLTSLSYHSRSPRSHRTITISLLDFCVCPQQYTQAHSYLDTCLTQMSLVDYSRVATTLDTAKPEGNSDLPVIPSPYIATVL